MPFNSLAAVTTKGKDDTTRELVFAYGSKDGSLAYLSVPLRADNRPIPPFAFTSDALKFYPNVGASVSSTQTNEVIHAASQLAYRDLSP